MGNWRKYWKNFSPAALVLLLFLPLPLTPCGPVLDYFHGYTFISEQILQATDREAMAPLLNSFDDIYEDFFEKKDSLNLNANIAEWQKRVCEWATPGDVAFIVYQAPISDLEQLRTNMGSKSLPVPSRLQGNTFAEYLYDLKCEETVTYLIFAKKCEPHVTLPADEWQAPKRDRDAMQALIAEGKKAFQRTKSPYIRLRYAYQIVRLAHYAKQWQQAVDLYEELMPRVDRAGSRSAESIIPWWVEGHYAGALLKLGRRAEASYRYAQIFRHSPGRRMSAYQSFRISTDAEWQDCLRLCQTDEERAMLHAIRAANPKSRAVGDMEAIYSLDPLNPQLEVLLVQEVKKVERSLLGLKFNSRREENERLFGLPAKGSGEYVISLQAFARRVREEAKVARPELWLIAEGYLEFLAGDFYAAQKTYREAERQVDDKALRDQLAAFRLALQIAQFERATVDVEEEAYEIMGGDLFKKYRSFPRFLQDKMTWLYQQSGSEAKAFITLGKLSDLKPNPSMELIDELLAIAQKPGRTEFEKSLMQGFSVSQLLDMKAVLLMSEGQLEAALQIYNTIPATDWDGLGQFNPFQENFHDRVHIDDLKDSLMLASGLNRGELLAQMVELEFQAKGDSEQAPRHFYKLGMAHYNMSYFGYSWAAMDYFRSGTTWANLHRGVRGVYPYFAYPIGNRENTDVSRALYYFEKARLLATSKELKARAAFQAARCEQKLYFVSQAYQPAPCCNNIPRLPEEYLVNFSRLKEEYADTDFYEWIIEECKYFEVYVAR